MGADWPGFSDAGKVIEPDTKAKTREGSGGGSDWPGQPFDDPNINPPGNAPKGTDISGTRKGSTPTKGY